MICDFHVHTRISKDSEADIDEVINAAIDKNMSHLAITDHHDIDYEDGTFEIDPFEYFKIISEYKDKYKNKINLQVGIEMGLEASKASRVKEFLKLVDFDFVIGSSHVANGLDPYLEEFWQGRSTKEGMDVYFLSIIENLKIFNEFDVYGHLDYAVRYSVDKCYKYNDCADYIDEALENIINMGKGIEINTGGLRKGAKTNPMEEVIRRYKELGGEIITVGSDAHFSKDVGAGFDIARQILLDSGFKYYSVFEGRKAKFLCL